MGTGMKQLERYSADERRRLGAAIRQRRIAAGHVSQEQVRSWAASIPLSVRTLGALERGVVVHDTTLYKTLAALGLTLAQIEREAEITETPPTDPGIEFIRSLNIPDDRKAAMLELLLQGREEQRRRTGDHN